AVLSDLTQLREKVERGQPIRMAFGDPYVSPTASAAATQAASGMQPARAVTETAISVTSESSRKRKKRKKDESELLRPRWTTFAMAAAAVALIGLLIFMLKPKSMEELYRESKPLMDSKDFADWDTAERRLEELERRFPNHPYQKEVSDLHDKVALHKT